MMELTWFFERWKKKSFPGGKGSRSEDPDMAWLGLVYGILHLGIWGGVRNFHYDGCRRNR